MTSLSGSDSSDHNRDRISRIADVRGELPDGEELDRQDSVTLDGDGSEQQWGGEHKLSAAFRDLSLRRGGRGLAHELRDTVEVTVPDAEAFEPLHGVDQVVFAGAERACG